VELVRGRFAFLLVAMLLARGSAALAAEPPPPISLSLRDTMDLWHDSGGLRAGAVWLNKLQLAATLRGDSEGLPGTTLHIQVFRTDGRSLSARVGDVQTVSNIEAVPAMRLFESWISKKFGGEDRWVDVRVGLMDLNSDFDSLTTPSLFVNSSHGIGPDLSRSGINGPSIFPVSALGARVDWQPSKRWTFKAAVLDGVPGDPDHPKKFVAIRLSQRDGAMTIGEADYHLTDKATLTAGAWRYSAGVVPAGGVPFHGHDRGFYAAIEGPVPVKGVDGWLRAGAADPAAQIVDSYLGAGLVATGLIPSRKDDRLGIAIAHAGIGTLARRTLGLWPAETTVEISYQAKAGNSFAVQPDLQYVRHPAAVARVPDALVVGLRLVFTSGYPARKPAAQAADPNTPPDGPPDPDPQ
jgi:porin